MPRGAELHSFKASTEDIKKQLAIIGAGVWRVKQTLQLLDMPAVMYEVWDLDSEASEIFFLAPIRDGEIQSDTIEVTEGEYRKANGDA